MRRAPARALALGVAALLLAGGTTGCTTPADPDPGSARAALEELPVKGRAPKTGYSREQFGSGWVDTDRNGCDTRDDVLARDLDDVEFRPGSDCVVVRGTLDDPYTGATIEFVRGPGTSEAVQIDHVVALSDAWQKGARSWDAQQRARFANDPRELLAVDGPTNSAKGDGDAATWLPPDTGYRCAYVERQIRVKTEYGLWVTRAEKEAMARVLDGCPAAGTPTTPTTPTAPAPTAPATPVPAVPFADCAAARAAGAAPVHAGDPGYSTRLDGDGDGTACE